MSNQGYFVETALLLLAALALGAAIGYFAQRWLAPRDIARGKEPTDGEPAKTAPAAEDDFVPQQPIEPAAKPEEPQVEISGMDEPGKPELLASARDGKPDNLKKIKGIGPKIETTLHGIGVYHYDQIAAWDDQAVTWVDQKLSFRGRIQREDWIAQAKVLAGRG